jgi:hypothetical protein
MRWIPKTPAVALVTLLIPIAGCNLGSEPLTPEVAQSALLEFASDPSMNGFRPEKHPRALEPWHSEFLDSIQSPDSLKAIAGPVTTSRTRSQIRIGPFDCNLRNRTVEFGTEYGIADERYVGIFIQDPSGRWKVQIVNWGITGW